MNEKIKKLTELRNSMWEPKLEVGCEIYRENQIDIVIFSMKDRPVDVPVEVIDFEGNTYSLTEKDIKFDVDFGKGKILGTPLSITDILRMLPKGWAIEKVNYGNGVMIEVICMNCKYVNIFWLDLSKGDYIKDQSEEVIDKLLKLFNIK